MTEERFMTYGEFKDKHNINISILRYLSIVSSIKKYIKDIPSSNFEKQYKFPPPFDHILTIKKGASLIYRKLINIEKKTVATGFLKWNKKVTISKEDWIEIFKNLKITTKDSKLIWLQYRISHSILTTNRSVSKFNNQQCHLCQFCNLHSETIHHLFWECHKVHTFWDRLSDLLNKRCHHTHNFVFEEKYVLFGLNENIYTDKICDFITMFAKMYIYKCKVQQTELNLNSFINSLYYRFQIEKINNHNSVKFRNLWGPYLNLFRSIQILDKV